MGRASLGASADEHARNLLPVLRTVRNEGVHVSWVFSPLCKQHSMLDPDQVTNPQREAFALLSAPVPEVLPHETDMAQCPT